MNERRVFLLGSGLIFALAVLAALAFARRRPPEYPPDDPRRIVQAYLQALEEQDYAQAHAYWDASLWPDAGRFAESLQETANGRRQYTVSIGAVTSLAPDKVVVTLHVRRLPEPPLFFPSEPQVVEAMLIWKHGAWRLTRLPPPWGPLPLTRPVPLPLTPGE